MSNIYTIAEIGINHNGCLESATKLIELASESGATAVKFQYRNSQRCYLSTNEIGVMKYYTLKYYEPASLLRPMTNSSIMQSLRA